MRLTSCGGRALNVTVIPNKYNDRLIVEAVQSFHYSRTTENAEVIAAVISR